MADLNEAAALAKIPAQHRALVSRFADNARKAHAKLQTYKGQAEKGAKLAVSGLVAAGTGGAVAVAESTFGEQIGGLHTSEVVALAAFGMSFVTEGEASDHFATAAQVATGIAARDRAKPFADKLASKLGRVKTAGVLGGRKRGAQAEGVEA